MATGYQTYSKPINKRKCLDQITTNEPSEIRPTILINITFNDFTYKDVEA